MVTVETRPITITDFTQSLQYASQTLATMQSKMAESGWYFTMPEGVTEITEENINHGKWERVHWLTRFFNWFWSLIFRCETTEMQCVRITQRHFESILLPFEAFKAPETFNELTFIRRLAKIQLLFFTLHFIAISLVEETGDASFIRELHVRSAETLNSRFERSHVYDSSAIFSPPRIQGTPVRKRSHSLPALDMHSVIKEKLREILPSLKQDLERVKEKQQKEGTAKLRAKYNMLPNEEISHHELFETTIKSELMVIVNKTHRINKLLKYLQAIEQHYEKGIESVVLGTPSRSPIPPPSSTATTATPVQTQQADTELTDFKASPIVTASPIPAT